MNSIGFGLGAFALFSAISLTTLTLHRRLPDSHLSKETQDAVKMGVGMVVVLSAFVLGLLIASVKTTFDAAARDLERFSTEIVLLDRSLRAYGPQALPTRNLLEHYVERALTDTWPTDHRPEMVEDPQAEQLLYEIQDAILGLPSDTIRQRALDDELKSEVRQLIAQRWTLIEDATGSLNVPIFCILVVWLGLVFASFGYKAPRNTLVVATFILCAASVAGALFLIIEMDSAFEGLIKVSAVPLQTALAHMQQ